jgi:hypothetical protein
MSSGSKKLSIWLVKRRRKLVKKISSVVLAAVLFCIAACSFSGSKGTGEVRIGCPDGVGGMLIHYLVNQKGLSGCKIINTYEVYEIKDCCSGAFQMTLGSERLDIAVMCPGAADILLKNDHKYEMIGPCLINSDIVVSRSLASIRIIGYARGRSYQEKLIKEIYGEDCIAAPMLPGAIPYAYEKKAVDAVVTDAIDALFLKGDKKALSVQDEDAITYTLVVRKSFKKDPRYKEFTRLYQEAVQELNRPEIIQKEINRYKKNPASGEKADEWIRWRIKFI